MNGNALLRWQERANARYKQKKLTKDNSILVIPFDLTMGYITSTETGIIQDNHQIYDYSTYQRVFTGLENVIAQWEGAYKVYKKNNADKFLTKEYAVGRSIRVFVPEENSTNTFEPSPISGDFLTQYTADEFILYSPVKFEAKDRFKLYIIPELQEFKWLYVEHMKNYYGTNNKFKYATVTLASLDNKIAKSGRAIEEFIQRGAPGEGYAWPVIKDGVVSLDYIRNRDIPITTMQIEMAGASAYGTLYAMGRPTIQKTEGGITSSIFNPKIKAPRMLLPYKMRTPIPSPINTKPTAETDWLVGRFKPTLTESLSNFKDQFEKTWDQTQRNNFQGYLENAENASITEATNPINQGTRNNLMWDSNWKMKVNKTYKTATNPFIGSTLRLNGNYTLPELLCHNIFGLSAFSSLPLSVEQNIAWNVKSIPIIGGFLSKLLLGIPFGWTDTAIKVKMDDIVLAIPASLKTYANKLSASNSSEIKIELNAFTDQQAQSEQIDFSGIKATGSIFKVELTDRFTKTINGVDYTFNTIDLGQSVPIYDKRGSVVPTGFGSKVLWDKTCKPAPRGTDTPGYVIDITTFQAIAKLDYRLSLASNDIPVMSGSYQTQSKFTTNPRDWLNIIKHSNWKATDNKVISYPKVIVAPNPPSINNPSINIPLKYIYFLTKLPQDIINTTPSTSLFSTQIQQRGSYWPDLDIYTLQEKNINKQWTIAKLDTTSYGGITSFKNNYKELLIAYEVDDTAGQIKLNIASLIASLSLTTTISTDIEWYEFTSNQKGSLRNASGKQGAGVYFKWKIKAVVSGNDISIIITKDITTKNLVANFLTSQDFYKHQRFGDKRIKMYHERWTPDNWTHEQDYKCKIIKINAIPKNI